MRKLLLFHVTGDDGYYESAGQAFDWPVVDEEFNQFSVQQLEEADTLVLGRVTCQLVLVLDGHIVTVPGVVTESEDQPGPCRHGRTLFAGGGAQMPMKLLRSRTFGSGAQEARYAPAG